jgi:hypothetical protein
VPFDPKATGLPTTHKPTGVYIMWQDRPMRVCTTWDAHKKGDFKKEKYDVRRQSHNSTSSVAAIYTRSGY